MIGRRSRNTPLSDAEPYQTAGEAYGALADQAAQSVREHKRANAVDVDQSRMALEQWRDNAQAQTAARTDYATQQGIQDLSRAQADAERQYNQQLQQIDLDEAKARDNQALYSAARGDRGGIGAAQYDAIASGAMAGRQAVYSARTRLAADTARQMADLRAQGEYQKADKALEIAQSYLTQLRAVEKWAAETNLSVEKLNASLDQWLSGYLLDLEKAGVSAGQWAAQQAFQREQFDWTKTKDQWNQENTRRNLEESRQKLEDSRQKQLSSTGLALLSKGLLPSDAQLRAMGLTRTQAERYAASVRQAAY